MIPADILVKSEKEKLRDNMVRVNNSWEEAKEAESVLIRQIYLLNKRMNNASLRLSFKA